jgi:hypothetical protein
MIRESQFAKGLDNFLLIEGRGNGRNGRGRADRREGVDDRCTLMLLKKSPHAVAAPQVKISTSQIGLQAARESWLGVKRPMKTSRNSSAPTFSTASPESCR